MRKRKERDNSVLGRVVEKDFWEEFNIFLVVHKIIDIYTLTSLQIKN